MTKRHKRTLTWRARPARQEVVPARILEICQESEGSSDDLRKAAAEYEAEKYAKSAVESVRSRLWWWRQKASEHEVQPFPLTVHKLQFLGALLKASGCWSAVAYLSAAKKEHVKLGVSWTGALDLELQDGRRACERGKGPPRKCGAFDLQKLEEVPTTHGALCKGPKWPREGALCGWWDMREIELSTTRCRQVTFKVGSGCGSCTFDLPVSKTDTQALGSSHFGSSHFLFKRARCFSRSRAFLVLSCRSVYNPVLLFPIFSHGTCERRNKCAQRSRPVTVRCLEM